MLKVTFNNYSCLVVCVGFYFFKFIAYYCGCSCGSWSKCLASVSVGVLGSTQRRLTWTTWQETRMCRWCTVHRARRSPGQRRHQYDTWKNGCCATQTMMLTPNGVISSKQRQVLRAVLKTAHNTDNDCHCCWGPEFIVYFFMCPDRLSLAIPMRAGTASSSESCGMMH